MKALKPLLALILGITSLTLASGCTKSAPKVTAVTPQETAGLLRNDFAVLVDVREAEEVKEGMAAGAQWMPKSKIDANDPAWQEFKGKLPKDKQIVLYCARGRRAGEIANQLAAEGYRVSNMGGYSEWVSAGLPTTKP